MALVFGAIGLVLAWHGLKDAGDNYEAFLLVIAYWIAPWLGAVLTDRWLRRNELDAVDADLVDTGYVNLAGPISMLLGMAISIWLFCDQEKYVGPVAKAHGGAIGDLTLFVGFAVSAVTYLILYRVLRPTRSR